MLSQGLQRLAQQKDAAMITGGLDVGELLPTYL